MQWTNNDTPRREGRLLIPLRNGWKEQLATDTVAEKGVNTAVADLRAGTLRSVRPR